MKVAYLAPEIPALSATFVYNEILTLEKRGLEILPISVHIPGVMAKEDEALDLARRTRYLYQESPLLWLLANISIMMRSPIRYFQTLLLALRDAWEIGITRHIGRGLLFRFFVAPRVVMMLSKEKCLHLHAHFAHVPTDIAMYASKLSRIPFSFTAHANDLFERGWLLKEKVQRAKVAVTISEYNRRFFVSQGIPEENVKIVRCGVPIVSQPDALRKRDIHPAPILGTLGRLVEKKGFDTLILALSQLNREGFDFFLELAGDGPLMTELRDLTIEQEIVSRVKFLGAMPHEKVFKWLQYLDIFVLACKMDKNGDQDGIPVVLMEAMALGVPVISTSISGIPELIKDGVSGLLALPNDPKSLARNIRTVWEKPDLADSMTMAGRERIREEFDTKLNIERLIRLFGGQSDEREEEPYRNYLSGQR